MKPTLLFIQLFIALIIQRDAICQGEKGNSKQALPVEASEIISGIKKAQDSIRTLSYLLEQTDTLVTGDTRIIRGRAMVRADKNDSLLGFEFRARRDGVHGESVYGGRIAYETDEDAKLYTVTTSPSALSHILWQSSGGQVILPDLVRLDTSGAIRFESWQDAKFVYLRLHYPDLTQYDVSRRSKTLTIDFATMLPVSMRRHQETLGKVQDLYYEVKELHINDPSFKYDFTSPPFLATFNQRIVQPAGPILSLKGLQAPMFTLTAFDDRNISLADLRGKVVLLDFWEVWCGPCVESMPEVERLYDTYKDKGLQVLGVINDRKQLEPSRLLAKKKGMAFPTLIGNKQLINDYKVGAIPLYILIDTAGKIVFMSIGYSRELEAAVGKALANR